MSHFEVDNYSGMKLVDSKMVIAAIPSAFLFVVLLLEK